MKHQWWESMHLEAPADGTTTSTVVLVPIGTFDTSGISHLPSKLTISRKLADELVANFDGQVMKVCPFIDDGGHNEDKATGWIKRLWVGEFPHAVSGEMMPGLLGEIEWTPLGVQLLADKLYRYLSVVIAPYHDEETGSDYTVLRSATLTNKPVMKMMPEVALEADELVSVALSEMGAPTSEEEMPVRKKPKAVSLGDVAAKIAEEQAEDESRTDMWRAISAFERLTREAIQGDDDEGIEPLTGDALTARLNELAAEFAQLAAEAAAKMPQDDNGIGTPGPAPLSDISTGKEGQDMKKLFKLEDGSEVNLAELPEVVALEAAKVAAETKLAEVEGEKRTARVEVIKTAAIAKGVGQATIDKLVALAISTNPAEIVLAEGSNPTDLLGAVESLVAELEVVPVKPVVAGEQEPPADGITLSETEKAFGIKFGISDERMLAAKKATTAGEEG